MPIEYAKATHLFAHLEDEVRVPDAGGGVEVECGHEVAVPRPRTRPEGEADTQELLLTQTVVLGRGYRVLTNNILVPKHILQLFKFSSFRNKMRHEVNQVGNALSALVHHLKGHC